MKLLLLSVFVIITAGSCAGDITIVEAIQMEMED
jgi:hypothetical protein